MPPALSLLILSFSICHRHFYLMQYEPLFSPYFQEHHVNTVFLFLCQSVISCIITRCPELPQPLVTKVKSQCAWGSVGRSCRVQVLSWKAEAAAIALSKNVALPSNYKERATSAGPERVQCSLESVGFWMKGNRCLHFSSSVTAVSISHSFPAMLGTAKMGCVEGAKNLPFLNLPFI